VPRLFPGELPILNLGTNSGLSCDPALREALTAVCQESGFSWVVDGRFKGGWITRHYGRPADGIHAVQMELAQRGYTDEARPGLWDPAVAAPLQVHLRHQIETALDWARNER
jgi:N-formylglutamate deformylase